MTTLAAEIGQLLATRNETIAIAESCTGGFIANAITNVPGASQYFDRGAVTYSNKAKQDWLAVAPTIIEAHGAVSEDCAKAMAVGIRNAAKSTYGISVTGIAGPSGGTPEKPVGTVFVGLASPSGVAVQKFFFPKGREAFKLAVCDATLEMLKNQLKG
ncbi:MAG: competence protein ComA [Deltaproteobacteria bacterium CG11_big_fil_rev_8_21_14_0_20_47_16]|nr:MAG: competence protein ComA [Deltaproteobacteria bacterium CG11_big_fil_rev_8_21_14_0_20_47_16]